MNVKRLWVYWQYQIFGFFSGSGLNFGSSSSGPGMSKLAQWSTCWSGGSGPNSPKLPGHIQTTLEWASNDQKAALLAIESLNSSGFMFCNFLVLRHCGKYSLLVDLSKWMFFFWSVHVPMDPVAYVQWSLSDRVLPVVGSVRVIVYMSCGPRSFMQDAAMVVESSLARSCKHVQPKYGCAHMVFSLRASSRSFRMWSGEDPSSFCFYFRQGPDFASALQDANRLTGPGTTPAFELSWMRCYDMWPE